MYFQIFVLSKQFSEKFNSLCFKSVNDYVGNEEYNDVVKIYINQKTKIILIDSKIFNIKMFSDPKMSISFTRK